jgi:hypothetical protein
MPKTLTQPQMILKAALGLGVEFHESQLAEAAWKAAPGAFGMRTMEAKYPDLNRVRAALCHKNGPVRKGHLAKVGELRFALTRPGRKEAEAIAGGERTGADRLRTVAWPTDLDAEVGRLLSTVACRKWAAGLGRDLGRADALAFFDGGEAARELVALMLADAAEYVAAGVPLACGRVVKVEELEALEACAAGLRKRFG